MDNKKDKPIAQEAYNELAESYAAIRPGKCNRVFGIRGKCLTNHNTGLGTGRCLSNALHLYYDGTGPGKLLIDVMETVGRVGDIVAASGHRIGVDGIFRKCALGG